MDRAPRRKTKPSLYNPEWMPNVAKVMCELGATMSELAQAFEVSSATLYKWLNQYPELEGGCADRRRYIQSTGGASISGACNRLLRHAA
jgi:transposase-like protein